MPSAIVDILPSGTGDALRQRGGVRRGALGLHADDAHVGAQALDRGRDAGEEPAAAARTRSRSARRGTARGSPGRRCPARRRCRGGRRGGSAPLRSRRRTASAATSASSTLCPWKRTSAPYPRVAFSLGIGAPSGMKTVAWMPSSCAASATPCAWLPALAATTPAAFSSGESRRHPQVGAADLERPGALQVLGLDQHRPAGQRGEPAGLLHRGVDRDPARAPRGPPRCRRGWGSARRPCRLRHRSWRPP